MKKTGARLIQYVGSVKLEDFTNSTVKAAVKSFCEKQESEVCNILYFSPSLSLFSDEDSFRIIM